MLPYPPSTKPGAAENSLLRVLGGVLALMSILLTMLGFILHQRLPDLILAIVVGIFALRVLILWLGDKPQQQQPFPMRSPMDRVMYPMQSPPFTQGHSAPYAPYVPPYSQFYPLDQGASEQHRQQFMPMPQAAVAPSPLNLPRSIRPHPNASAFPAQPASPPQVMQPISSSQSANLWLPPPNVSAPISSLAQVSMPSQEGNWQYDDRENFTQQQRGNDDGTA